MKFVVTRRSRSRYQSIIWKQNRALSFHRFVGIWLIRGLRGQRTRERRVCSKRGRERERETESRREKRATDDLSFGSSGRIRFEMQCGRHQHERVSFAISEIYYTAPSPRMIGPICPALHPFRMPATLWWNRFSLVAFSQFRPPSLRRWKS